MFDPARYNEIPVLELLRAASKGWIGVDRRLLKSILDRGASSATEVLAFAREPRQGDRLNLDPLLIDLFRHYGTAEALDFFIDAVRRAPDDVDQSLIYALLPFGDKAVGPLLALYEELGEESGSDVAFLLASLRVHDPRVLAVLLERLEFDAADGAFCLGLYGDPAARPALEQMLAEIPEDDVELRRELSHALEELDAPQPKYEAEAFDIFAEYPQKELPDVDVLAEAERMELLSSAEPDVRAAAAFSFFNAELHPKAKTALFDLAKSDPDPAVRGRCWQSLSDAVADEAVRDSMLAVFLDPGRPVPERGGAAVGLYPLAERDDVRRGLESLYGEGGPARAKALESMWRSLFRPFAKYFAPHLDDKSPAILHQALRGAGYFRLSAHADKIASYFENEDFRDDALFAYALAMPGETTRGRVRGMLRKIDSIADLDPTEVQLVAFALDERLRLAGLDPVFETDAQAEEEEEPQEPPAPSKVGRNDPCPCGSGQKYKKCHGK